MRGTMLWQYTLILLVVALAGTVIGFHKSFNRLGQVLMLFVAAIAWSGFGISLLKVTFKWAGSTNVISYTYIPSAESGFIYLFYALGMGCLALGGLKAWKIVFQPVVSGYDELAGRRPGRMSTLLEDDNL